MEEKIAKLEKQVRILTTLLMLLVLAVFLMLITRNQPDDPGRMLRVKGVIVEDSTGHKRILMIKDSVDVQFIDIQVPNEKNEK